MVHQLLFVASEPPPAQESIAYLNDSDGDRLHSFGSCPWSWCSCVVHCADVPVTYSATMMSKSRGMPSTVSHRCANTSSVTLSRNRRDDDDAGTTAAATAVVVEVGVGVAVAVVAIAALMLVATIHIQPSGGVE